MNYYAVQVMGSREETFIQWMMHHQEEISTDIRFFFPRRRLTIRRQGKHFQELYPVFPGYVFVEASEVSIQLYKLVRRAPYFCRFLPSNDNIQPLGARDLAILVHFIGNNDIAESSKVYFDENDRIVVVSGPLSGMEGNIVKVDRRKKRAKVRLDFANEAFHLDLAFDVIERSSKGASSEEESLKEPDKNK